MEFMQNYYQTRLGDKALKEKEQVSYSYHELPRVPGKDQEFTCVIKFGDISQQTGENYKSISIAAESTAKHVYYKITTPEERAIEWKRLFEENEKVMANRNTNEPLVNGQNANKSLLNGQNVDKPLVNSQVAEKPRIVNGCLGVSDLSDLLKLPIRDSALAANFQLILHHQLGDIVAFKVDKCKKKGIEGFSARGHYKGKTYASLAPMMTERQAIESAAERCCRSLGILPHIKDDAELVIQPFRGGSTKPMQMTLQESSRIFATLPIFLDSHYLYGSKYYLKNNERKVNGSMLRTFQGLYVVGGKAFLSDREESSESLARCDAALQAIKYFHITAPIERIEMASGVRIKNHAYLQQFLNNRQPNVCQYYLCTYTFISGWLWRCLPFQHSYEDTSVESLFESEVFYRNRGKAMSTQFVELVKKELTMPPSFEGEELESMDNLCIAEIDAENPNLVTVGNDSFSIKMIIENGKINCLERNAEVEVLPGHRIHKLIANYRISPNTEIYLKADKCSDLFYPNPPLPVLTSCGMVLLYHNCDTSLNDIQVLLVQTFDQRSFMSKCCVLKEVLQLAYNPEQIFESKGNFTSSEECMSNVMTWSDNEVKLLGEMTAKSLRELLQHTDGYEEEWDKMFEGSELPEPLKEVQTICLDEMKRRVNEGIKIDGNENWNLPQGELKATYDVTGIHITNSFLCAFQTIAEQTGLSVSLRDLEKCPTLDLPVEENKNKHSGDFTKFYIWSGFTPSTKLSDKDALDVTFKRAIEDVSSADGWYLNDKPHRDAIMGMIKSRLGKRKSEKIEKTHSFKKTKLDNTGNDRDSGQQEVDDYLSKVKATPVITDGQRKGGLHSRRLLTPECYAAMAKRDQLFIQMCKEKTETAIQAYKIESTNCRRILRQANKDFAANKGNARVLHQGKCLREYEDGKWCRWFSLDEALSLCPLLKKISDSSAFRDKLKGLMADANQVLLEKGFDEKVTCSLLNTS